MLLVLNIVYLTGVINPLITDLLPEEHTEELSWRRITLTIDNYFPAYVPGTHFAPECSENLEKKPIPRTLFDLAITRILYVEDRINQNCILVDIGEMLHSETIKKSKTP